jgi:hypothetical protein
MSEAYDIMEWLRDSAPPGPLGRRMAEAADEIANLREEIEALPLLPGDFSRPGVVRYTCTRRALVVRPPCDGLTPPPPPLIQPYRLENEWRAATWTLRAS